MPECNRSVRTKIVIWIGAIFGALVLIYLIFWAMWLSAEHGARSEYNASRHAESIQNRIDSSCSGLNGSALSECVREAVEATREYQRAEEDLKAQKDMALWALGMLVATGVLGFITLVVSIVGVWFVIRTFEQTRRQANIAEDSAQKQLRAYIVVDSSSLSIKERIGPGLYHAVFSIKFKNAGQTPAYRYRTQIAWQAIKSGDFPMKIEQSMKGKTETIVGPGVSTSSAGSYDLEQIDIDRLNGGEYTFHVFGRVQYEDIFGTARYLLFSLANGDMVPDGNGWFMRPTRTGNAGN